MPGQDKTGQGKTGQGWAGAGINIRKKLIFATENNINCRLKDNLVTWKGR